MPVNNKIYCIFACLNIFGFQRCIVWFVFLVFIYILWFQGLDVIVQVLNYPFYLLLTIWLGNTIKRTFQFNFLIDLIVLCDIVIFYEKPIF